MSLLERPAVRAVQAALARAGSAARIVELAATARTAEEAAAACGVEQGAIVKTLAFAGDHAILLALVAGDRRCDTAVLGRALGQTAAPGRATPADVKAATGFTIGGVAPLGHPAPLATAIDPSLARFERLFAAAGHPHCVFATTYDELCALSGAIAAHGLGRA